VIIGTAGAVECEAWVSAGVIESKGSWPSSREYETIGDAISARAGARILSRWGGSKRGGLVI
jgi:hypothetical protein